VTPRQCIEGEPFGVDAATRQLLNLSFTRLQRELRFRSWPLSDSPGGKMTISGVVGTIALSDGTAIDVTPKTNPDENWIQSVLGLLSISDRIDAAGERRAGLVPEHRNLRAVMAAIYASRLEEAVRREGPLILLRRQDQLRSSLRGKLNATTWLKHALSRPHLFPTETAILTTDNEFARAMAFVAELLARETSNHGVKSRLYALQKALLPGRAVQNFITSGVALRVLPAQWVAYEPAWSIARAILLRKSLLGATGRQQGISIAIEMWPLLERLLIRSLRSAAQLARNPPSVHAGISVPPKPYSRVLLTPPEGSSSTPRSVYPDGWLVFDEKTRATFDAKYKKRKEGAKWPNREDIYQVVTTAAAYNSPLAVLVYPEKFETVWWNVSGLKGTPRRLAAIGLGLFSFKPGVGDLARGREILDLLDASQSSEISVAGNISI
jgi:5-methylcytosine-specific restriction endonuclease McrBC regulatory subunit McrC